MGLLFQGESDAGAFLGSIPLWESLPEVWDGSEGSLTPGGSRRYMALCGPRGARETSLGLYGVIAAHPERPLQRKGHGGRILQTCAIYSIPP